MRVPLSNYRWALSVLFCFGAPSSVSLSASFSRIFHWRDSRGVIQIFPSSDRLVPWAPPTTTIFCKYLNMVVVRKRWTMSGAYFGRDPIHLPSRMMWEYLLLKALLNSVERSLLMMREYVEVSLKFPVRFDRPRRKILLQVANASVCYYWDAESDSAYAALL